MSLVVYGIRNCDTCRKALKWLKERGIDHTYHDFREHGLSDRQLAGWLEALGWEALLNRRSLTWRNLPEAHKAEVDIDKAAALMLDHPTLIKRPIFDNGIRVFVGFDAAAREALGGD